MTRRSPFRYITTSPEIIRLAAMRCMRFPLSLRNVEDLQHERGIEIRAPLVRENTRTDVIRPAEGSRMESFEAWSQARTGSRDVQRLGGVDPIQGAIGDKVPIMLTKSGGVTRPSP